MKLLEGKVAVVTGAGGGLGRCHALALAGEGAKVVVNDPDVSRDGTGGGSKMADAVVEEIRKSGGQAVPNYDSVADAGDRVVKAAVEAFGRVDILVNNAGILRDKTIHNMTDEMWDLVIAVHLRGTFLCTRAAAKVMKEMGTGGRIINTTSVAGLKGNFGQSNYSAAKAGIYGFTMTASMEFLKDGITINAIAPIAKTRMTQEIDSVPAEYKPEDVSPVVVFLASDLAKDLTGQIIGVHGRHLFRYTMEMSEGREQKEAWTPAEVNAWIRSPEKPHGSPAQAPHSPGGNRVAQVFQSLAGAFDAEKAAGWDALIHFSIAGAGDWTVEVKDKKLRVSDGKPPTPTSTITVDADTLMGMVEGKIKGDMAFMSGKLKATRVPDLAKFGKAFDFRKIKIGAPVPASGSPAAPRSSADLASLLARLRDHFLPDKATGFNATLLFKVDGQAATLEIKDKSAVVKPPVATATCTLSTDGATLTGIVDGSIDGQKAFSEGKIKITHLPSWLKFRQMFTFAPEKGLHRSLIGKRYGGAAQLIRPEKLAAYDAAVGDRGSIIFPVTLVKDPFVRLFEDPEFNGELSRMVHGEQVFVFHRPLRPWDLVTPRGRVLGIEDKSSGQILNFGQRIYCEGNLLVGMESRLFFRGDPKGAKPAVAASAAPRPAPSSTSALTVPADLPRRYAEASGDMNPIHVDKSFAQSAGFKDVILHGLGTLALVARTFPQRPRTLRVRFAKPVYPGDQLATSFWKSGDRFEFETLNAEGEAVLAQGSAEV